MKSWTWLRNTIRNAGRRTFLFKTMRSVFPKRIQPETLCLIAATRLSEQDFWSKSALGQSVTKFLNNKITIHIAFNNTDGLSKVYNTAIHRQNADILIFLHDDVWIEDEFFIEKIIRAMKDFDIAGVAGNTRISKNQPAWLFKELKNNKFIWDHGHLSGVVRHGTPGHSSAMAYGPTPAKCQLLDGVLLAARRKTLLQSNTFFDERFYFHFYDLDFCRTARHKGLSLGTWPIDIVHFSGGAFGSQNWQSAYATYLQKWKN